MSQFYRNKQGFIIMCDLSDESSVMNVPSWIKEIEDRSQTLDHVIMVLANKCDLMDNIDQSIVLDLETDLEHNYPHVEYREISVLLNIYLERSLSDLAEMMQ